MSYPYYEVVANEPFCFPSKAAFAACLRRSLKKSSNLRFYFCFMQLKAADACITFLYGFLERFELDEAVRNLILWLRSVGAWWLRGKRAHDAAAVGTQ